MQYQDQYTRVRAGGGDILSDILQGASQIAEFMFGSASDRRRVYFLVESGALPHFKLGGTICARRSTLIEWIEKQEATSCRVQASSFAEAR